MQSILDGKSRKLEKKFRNSANNENFVVLVGLSLFTISQTAAFNGGSNFLVLEFFRDFFKDSLRFNELGISETCFMYNFCFRCFTGLI